MAKYAERTKVTEEKSREEIDKALKKYGATQRIYGFDDATGVARIAFGLRNRRLRFDVVLPRISEFTRDARGKVRTQEVALSMWQQAVRQKWRSFALSIKGRLESVDAEVFTFEEEFGMAIVLPNGQTVGEWVAPQVEAIYQSGQMPKALPGLPEDVRLQLEGPKK